MTITNIEYNQFIGIYDTEYDTDDLIEYWRYQDKCGATFKRVGTWGASGKKAQGVHARKDSCLATSDFMMDHACGCLLYTSPSPRDRTRSRMPSSA